jgi:hypothetical protein
MDGRHAEDAVALLENGSFAVEIELDGRRAALGHVEFAIQLHLARRDVRAVGDHQSQVACT